MRKVHFFLNSEFNSKKCFPTTQETRNFKRDLTNLVRNIKFHKQVNAFQ